MLTEIADGVLVHESAFMQSNAIVVRGDAGVLLIDAGVQEHEIVALAEELQQIGPVVAGFSTHPHWDHLLWHPSLGTAPRHGTARCAATVDERQVTQPETKARIAAQLIPPDVSPHVSLDLLGLIDGLPADATHLHWDGPRIRIVEHQGHAPGHAALIIEDRGVLVAGDMVSDVLIPLLDLNGATDPIGDYVAGLDVLAALADEVTTFVPGHGSVGDAAELRTRIALDRTYVHALRDSDTSSDARIDADGPNGSWLPGVHAGQAQRLADQRATRCC